jgi:hypothetical protein
MKEEITQHDLVYFSVFGEKKNKKKPVKKKTTKKTTKTVEKDED